MVTSSEKQYGSLPDFKIWCPKVEFEVSQILDYFELEIVPYLSVEFVDSESCESDRENCHNKEEELEKLKKNKRKGSQGGFRVAAGVSKRY